MCLSFQLSSSIIVVFALGRLLSVLQSGSLRGPIDRHRSAVREVDQHVGRTTDAGGVGIDHAQNEGRRDCRVDGITAPFEYVDRGLSGLRRTGRNHAEIRQSLGRTELAREVIVAAGTLIQGMKGTRLWIGIVTDTCGFCLTCRVFHISVHVPMYRRRSPRM